MDRQTDKHGDPATRPSTGVRSARSDGSGSGFGQPGADRAAADVNVSPAERIVTGVGGALLALSGLRHGGLGGVLGVVAGGALLARATTGHCPLYARIASSDQEQRVAGERGWDTAAVTRESVLIQRPREQLFAFWREFSNLPRVMSHVERVEVLDANRSRWTIALPLGKELHWTSRVTEERANERIAWSADADADVANSGWVEFREAGSRGTEVTVQIAFEPPAGELGHALVKLWPRSPGALLKHDLEQFRRRVESGEIALGATDRRTSATPPQPDTARH